MKQSVTLYPESREGSKTFFFFFEIKSHYLGWLGTGCVDQVGLELLEVGLPLLTPPLHGTKGVSHQSRPTHACLCLAFFLSPVLCV